MRGGDERSEWLFSYVSCEARVPANYPPQALILGIGAGVEKPWQVGDDIALATIMAATASFDSRAVDGAGAARFMSAFRGLGTFCGCRPQCKWISTGRACDLELEIVCPGLCWRKPLPMAN